MRLTKTVNGIALTLAFFACEKKDTKESVVDSGEPLSEESSKPYVAKTELDPMLDQNRVGNVRLLPTGDQNIAGTVLFSNSAQGYNAKITLSGLKPNATHALHIHENGDCSNSGKAAGGHFSLANEEHGKPGETGVHFGDLGNVTADAEGVVDTIVTKILAEDLRSQVAKMHEKAVILHGESDEFVQPTGDAGPRIACGIIKEDVVEAH